MRAYEFLVEYDRSITIKNTKIDRLIAVANVDPFFRAVQNKDDINAFIDVIFEAIESRDPTPSKVYVPWLVRVYMVGDISVGQLNGNGELTKYHTAKGRGLLSGVIKNKEIKDFTTYKTYQSFVEALNAINIDDILNKDTKAEKKANVDRGTYDTLLSQGNATVVIPRDLKAAMFWGQNTAWCTAASENNKFSYYKDDPIYVISPRKPEKKMVRKYNKKKRRWKEIESVEKYQISFKKDEVKDSNNKPYRFRKLVGKFPLIYNVLKNDAHFPAKYLSKEDMTEDKQLAAVNDGRAAVFWDLIEAGITPSEPVLLAALQKYWCSIDDFEPGTPLFEMVQIATARNDTKSIWLIIESGVTPSEKVWLAALKRYGYSINNFEPGTPLIEMVQIAAASQNNNYIDFIIDSGMVPCEKAQLASVTRHSTSIKLIIDAGIKPSEAVQLAAVTNHGNAMQYIINAGIKPSEAVQVAAVSNGADLWTIMTAGITPSDNVLLAALKRYKHSIDDFEPGTPLIEMVQMAAVTTSSYTIWEIMKAGITPNEEILLMTLKTFWCSVDDFEPGTPMLEMVQLASVSVKGSTIEQIIDAGITPSEDVQIAAVSNDGGAIGYIIGADIKPSEDVQIAAVYQDGNAIDIIIDAGITPSNRVKEVARRSLHNYLDDLE